MDKNASFLFLLFIATLFLLQPIGFAEQEKSIAVQSFESENIDPPKPLASSLAKESSQLKSIENSKHQDAQLTVLEESPEKLSVNSEKLGAENNEPVLAKLVQQQKHLEEKNKNLAKKSQALAEQQQSLEEQRQLFKEKQKTADEEILKRKTLLDDNSKFLMQQRIQLAEKERLTNQKLLQIENHWLTKAATYVDKHLSEVRTLYLIIAVILFFLPFIFLLRSRRKQNLSQLTPEQGNDYIADNRNSGKGRLSNNVQENPSSEGPPIVQVVEVNGNKIMDRRAARPQNNVVANKPLIWLAIIAIPLLLYFYLIESGVSKEVATYTGIVAITLIMWMSSLLPEFIPALIGLLLVLLFGLAPNEIVLSGFSSPGFLLLFSVMGLGAVITSSGLTKRYTLWLVKSIPSNLFANQFAIFVTGLVFNPIVPTINGRAMIVAPILRNIVRGWDDKTKAKSSTPLYTSGLDGINFLSPIFLTAAPANLMIYGLLPSQEQHAFEFIFWIYAASLVGIVMFVLYFIVSALFFRSFTQVKISKDDVEDEWKKLGKFSWCEWIALTGIILMAIGIATSSIHKVPIPLITFGVLCAVLVIGVLSRDQFIKQIDWSFLVLLASMIGILATMNYLGIEKTLVTQFSWLGEYMRNDFHMFVLVLTGMILFVRIFIPLNSAILIFAAALLPLATGAGVSAWVVGFIILIMCGTAFWGYQSPYILYFRSLLKGDVPFVDLKYQIFQIVLVFVKLAAIYASIPFWIEIGVL